MNETVYSLPICVRQDPFEATAMLDYWLDKLYFRTFVEHNDINEILTDICASWETRGMRGESGVTVRNMLLDARSIHMRGDYAE